MSLKVFIGWDPNEQGAYAVCEASLKRHATIPVDVQRLNLESVRRHGLYTRPHEVRDGRLWDVISSAPMSTEFALTRFLVPVLAGMKGWALYCDSDFLWRDDVACLFALADPAYAVQVVKHDYRPVEPLKMGGQVQTDYRRKLWSSLILWNCAHDAHVGQVARVAQWRGLWLHQFRWLQDDDIGSLPGSWNWIEHDPSAVHYTRGSPNVAGYEHSAYADEWRQIAELSRLD